MDSEWNVLSFKRKIDDAFPENNSTGKLIFKDNQQRTTVIRCFQYNSGITQNSMLTFHLNIIMKTDNIQLFVVYFWL
jgi:hypothetical protein